MVRVLGLRFREFRVRFRAGVRVETWATEERELINIGTMAVRLRLE